MAKNIPDFSVDLVTKWTVFAVLLFFQSCRSVKPTTVTNTEYTAQYRDTSIDIPFTAKRWDVEAITDTVLKDDDGTLQIIHDATGMAQIYYLQAPRTIKLDSVIRYINIRETIKTTTTKNVCTNKFHSFTATFFKWTLSIFIFYAGMKAVFK